MITLLPRLPPSAESVADDRRVLRVSAGEVRRTCVEFLLCVLISPVENAEQLDRVLSRNSGQLHDVAGVPNSPPTYNPNANSYKGIFGHDKQFRIQFGKARRMVHIKEAKELRDGLKRGTAHPARRYLERSQNQHLS